MRFISSLTLLLLVVTGPHSLALASEAGSGSDSGATTSQSAESSGNGNDANDSSAPAEEPSSEEGATEGRETAEDTKEDGDETPGSSESTTTELQFQESSAPNNGVTAVNESEQEAIGDNSSPEPGVRVVVDGDNRVIEVECGSLDENYAEEFVDVVLLRVAWGGSCDTPGISPSSSIIVFDSENRAVDLATDQNVTLDFGVSSLSISFGNKYQGLRSLFDEEIIAPRSVEWPDSCDATPPPEWNATVWGPLNWYERTLTLNVGSNPNAPNPNLTTGFNADPWTIVPPFPSGLSLHGSGRFNSVSPSAPQETTIHKISTTQRHVCGPREAFLTLTVVGIGPASQSRNNLLVGVPMTPTAVMTAGFTTEGTTTYSITPALVAGLEFDSATGVISGTPTAPRSQTTHTIRGTRGNESYTATVQISAIQPVETNRIALFDSDFIEPTRPLVPTLPCSPTFSVSPSLPSGMSFDSNVGVITGRSTAASLIPSTHTITASCDGQSQTATVTILKPGMSPNSSFTLSGRVGEAVTPTRTHSLVAFTNSANVTYSITCGTLNNIPLVAGLTLDSATGVISGTPTAPQSSTTCRLVATNGDERARVTVTIVVGGMVFPVTNLNLVLDQGVTTAQPQAPVFTGACCPATIWTINPALPTGLSVNNQGRITGNPRVVHPTTIHTITVTRGTESFSAQVSVTVRGLFPRNLNFYPTFGGTFGPSEPYDAQHLGPNPVFSISRSGGQPAPDWVSIDPTTGVITGTAPAIQNAPSLTVKATDGEFTLEATVNVQTLGLLPAPSQISIAIGEPMPDDSEFELWFVGSAGDGNPTWSVTPELPEGLSLSTQRPLSGQEKASIVGSSTSRYGPTVHQISAEIADPGGGPNLTYTTQVTLTIGGGTSGPAQPPEQLPVPERPVVSQPGPPTGVEPGPPSRPTPPRGRPTEIIVPIIPVTPAPVVAAPVVPREPVPPVTPAPPVQQAPAPTPSPAPTPGTPAPALPPRTADTGSVLQRNLERPSGTVDFGSGVQSSGGATQGAPGATRPTVEVPVRTPGEKRAEVLQGFAPGSTTEIEVVGARTGARFVLSAQAASDKERVADAMASASTSSSTDFFEVRSVQAVSAPEPAPSWDDAERNAVSALFESSGLPAPKSLNDFDVSGFTEWVKIESEAKTYVPGSTVYLTVTSDPIVIGQAKVNASGDAELVGTIPAELLGAGEHRIRLIGIRLLDGVSVDQDGNVQVSDATMAEIQRFDQGTQVTVAVLGQNPEGEQHTALRIVALPEDPRVSWWPLWLIVGAFALFVAARTRGLLGQPIRRSIGLGVVGVSALPAIVMGVASGVLALTWWGLAAGLLALGLAFFVPHRDPEAETA